MTAIKFIRGIPKPGDRARVNDSPQLTHPKTYKNWIGKSEGEFNLQLMLDRVLIDKAYYGDYEGIYTTAENMLGNALRRGLHTAPGVDSFGAIPSELNSVAAAIKRAKKKIKAAFTKIPQAQVAGPFDPYANGNFEIDCFEISQELQRLQNEFANLSPNIPQSVRNRIQNDINQYTALVDACNQNGAQIRLLNDKLEESAHDFTYGFFPSAEVNANTLPQTVINKVARHENYLFQISKLAGLSESNLRLWTDNGIKRQNTRSGTQPWNGRDTGWGIGYSTLDGDTTRIGDLFTVIALVTAGAKLIGALLRAISSAIGMHNSNSRKQQLEQLVGSSPGSGTFDPSKNDWSNFALPLIDSDNNVIDPIPGPGSGGNTDDGSNTGLILGGSALLFGLYLLNQNNNNG